MLSQACPSGNAPNCAAASPTTWAPTRSPGPVDARARSASPARWTWCARCCARTSPKTRAHASSPSPGPPPAEDGTCCATRSRTPWSRCSRGTRSRRTRRISAGRRIPGYDPGLEARAVCIATGIRNWGSPSRSPPRSAVTSPRSATRSPAPATTRTPSPPQARPPRSPPRRPRRQGIPGPHHHPPDPHTAQGRAGRARPALQRLRLQRPRRRRTRQQPLIELEDPDHPIQAATGEVPRNAPRHRRLVLPEVGL